MMGVYALDNAVVAGHWCILNKSLYFVKTVLSNWQYCYCVALLHTAQRM